MNNSFPANHQRQSKRSRRHLVTIVLLAILLPACSTIEIGYRMADRLAMRYVAGYTKLTNRQKGVLTPKFEERMESHAQRELPQYVDLFAYAKNAAEDELTRQEVDFMLEELRRLYALLIDESIPLAVTTLQMLDDDQLRYFQRRLQKQVDEDLEDMERDPQVRLEQRSENVVDDLEDWTGNLDDEQVALVASYVARMADTHEGWQAFREDRNRQLIQALRNDVSKRRLSRLIHDGWVSYELADENLRDLWAENREVYRAMLVELDTTLTSRQRNKLVKRFAKYEKNLANLLPDDDADDRVASIH